MQQQQQQQTRSMPEKTIPVTVEALAQAGFTADAIARFTWLKERYPLCEFVEHDSQIERMEFIRWLVGSGRLVA